MDYVKCQQKRSDCVFWACGKCLALEDTLFLRKCPFYKPCENDYAVEYSSDKFKRTFRPIKGLGGLYMIAADGYIINSHDRPIKSRMEYGAVTVHLRYNDNFISIKVADLVRESFPEKGAEDGKQEEN